MIAFFICKFWLAFTKVLYNKHKNSSVGIRHPSNFSCTAVKFHTNTSRIPGLSQGITTRHRNHKRHWKNPFRYHGNNTKRSPWVICSHIAQLTIHPSYLNSTVNFAVMYKPFGILQRVTKSQKIYISMHNT